MSIRQRFEAQPRSLLLAELYVGIVLLGIADYYTDWEMSLFVFYAVPIFGAAWYLDQKHAMFLAFSGAVLWWLANAEGHPYASNLAYLWAAVSRCFYFCVVAIGGGALAARTEALRSRLLALERAARLEQELVRASEREQRRIGQDLHDGLCQSLVAIGFAAESLQEDLEGKAPAEAGAAGALARMVRDAIAEARSMARGIFPVQMNTVGLAAALDELAASITRLRHIDVTFETNGDVSVTDAQIGMHLYRIAQEALSNAVTHSGAKRIAASLVADEDGLRLTIRDNGAGFSAPSAIGQGMGMTTMRYRAAQIGATLDVRSHGNEGTEIMCILPKTNIAHTSPEYVSTT